MALFIISGTQTTTQTLGFADEVIVTRTGLLAPSGGPAIANAAAGSIYLTIMIEGAVYANFDAIVLNATDVVSGSSIQLSSTGVVAGLNGNAMRLSGIFNTIDNLGAIWSPLNSGFAAIRLESGSDTVLNGGTISGYQGIELVSFSDGLSSIVNSGEIRTLQQAILTEAQSLDIVNSGTIAAARAPAIVVGSPLSFLSVFNAEGGVITGQPQLGGGFAIQANAASDLIVNRGLIAPGIDMGGGNDRLDNRGGTIAGTVSMGTEDDRLDNRGGMIEGSVLLGAGDDRLDTRGGGITGSVAGGAGNDTYLVSDDAILLVEVAGEGTDIVLSTIDYALAAGIENLTLLAGATSGLGNTLRNTLTGNTADNHLDGGANHDRLNGRAGDDRLLGGAGNDQLRGDEGDDLLFGGAGNDTLRGGEGEDLLVGGAGRDTLYGEGDADIFLFTRRIDSPDSSLADQIMDFEQGLDRIDLTSFLTTGFRGSLPFTGMGPEVRVTVQGTNSLVRIDTDGDGAADMRIVVRDVTALTEADFLL